MFNDIANLFSSIVRIFVTVAVLLAALLWIVIKLGNMGALPYVVGALPVALVFWAFAKRTS